MKLTLPQKISLGFLILLIAFWAVLFFNKITEGAYNFTYSFLFGLIPLIGGIVSMKNSATWGGFKSAVGKAVFFIGLGLFCWGAGETIWSYYNFFLNVAAPYPSLADLGFAPSIFFYGLGIVYLSKATGAKFGLRNPLIKTLVAVALVAVSIFSYYILVVVARGGVVLTNNESIIKGILDVAYPLGDFFALALAVVISGLSFKYFGGKYILSIAALLAGLGVMFIADSVFSYTTTIGTYYNADFGDLILTIGVWLLTFGVLGFFNSSRNTG